MRVGGVWRWEVSCAVRWRGDEKSATRRRVRSRAKNEIEEEAGAMMGKHEASPTHGPTL